MLYLNGTVYYTLIETMNEYGLSEKVCRNLVKQHQKDCIQQSNRTLIPKAVILNYMNGITNFSVIITESDKKTDVWLQDKNNLSNLNHWAKAVQIPWSKLTLEDYIRIWKYIIMPLYNTWRTSQPNPEQYSIRPTREWLSQNKLYRVVRFFRDGYGKKYGVNTIGEFFVKYKI